MRLLWLLLVATTLSACRCHLPCSFFPNPCEAVCAGRPVPDMPAECAQGACNCIDDGGWSGPYR